MKQKIRRNRNILLAGILLVSLWAFLKVSATGQTIKVRVIDGDTIQQAGGKRIRLIGIDTPETHKYINDEWIDVNQPYGKEAMEYTKQFCREKIRIEYDIQKRDKYNRLLGYVFSGNKMLNEELLENGLAYLFFMEPNGKYANRMFLAHKQAVKQRIGIWSMTDSIINPEEMPSHTGEVKITCGNAHKIIFSDNGVIALLDGTFSNYIEIPTTVAFEHAEDIKAMEGRDICAEGKIKEKSGRHFIRIFHYINIFPEEEIE